jgi:hypothetical protein
MEPKQVGRVRRRQDMLKKHRQPLTQDTRPGSKWEMIHKCTRRVPYKAVNTKAVRPCKTVNTKAVRC